MQVCLSGRISHCPVIDPKYKLSYNLYWGGYSTHMMQPEGYVFKHPDGLPDNVAGPLLCAGVTTYGPIVRHLKKGMKTAVFGIGGLGHLAIQYLAKLGYDVTALTTSMSKKDLIMKLGATRVIDFNSEEDLKTWDSQFDAIINTGSGSGSYDKLLGLSIELGMIIHLGSPPYSDKISFGNLIVAKGIKIIGSVIGSPTEVQEMLDFSTEHKIYPMCDEFDFEDMPKAFEHMESGKSIFRTVVKVKDYSEKNGYFK